MTEPEELESAPEATPAARPGSLLSWRAIPLGLLSLLILWYLVRGLGGFEALVGAFDDVDAFWLGLAAATIVPLVLAPVLRWQLTLKTMGYSVPLRTCATCVLATWPLAVATPSRASDVLRSWLIKETVPVSVGVGSVLVDKLVSLWGLSVMCAVGSAFVGLHDLLAVSVGLLLLQWAAIVAATRFRPLVAKLPGISRFAPKLEAVFVALEQMRGSRGLTAALLGVGIISWVPAITLFGLLLWATGVEMGVLEITATYPIAQFVGMLPITLAGMGTRDAAFLYLATSKGTTLAPEAAVLAATMLFSLLGSWAPALIGAPLTVAKFGARNK